MNIITALQVRLKALSEDAGNIQLKLKDARTALRDIHASQLLVTKARKTLNATAEAVDKLIAAATDAKDAAAPLDIDTPATMAGLPGVKKSVTKIATAAEAAKLRGQAAAEALQTVSAPTQMSKKSYR